ncbi:MAG: hypothetical protein IJK45_03905, partial [Bacteroidaceae bacterium]|nr:hypothetical protein [Bacteroidaceae bacterium]
MKRLITLFIALAMVGIVQAEETTLQGTVIDQDEDYHPFVTKWKRWHVIDLSEGTESLQKVHFFSAKDITIGEHTYLNLYEGDMHDYYMEIDNYYGKETWGNYDDGKILLGLFREEDGRVYLYDKTTEQEYCVYDFTLEEGDTFDIGWGDEADRCVVTKVDHTVVEKSKYGDHENEKLKTITFSSINDEPLHHNHKWIEGIGTLSGPADGWIPNAVPSSWNYGLAYCIDYIDDSDIFYPFSFCDLTGDNNFVLGQELEGKPLGYDPYYWEDSLKCEIIDEKLHVFGHMVIQCGPYNYVYCNLKPSDTYNTYQITVLNEGVEPTADCGDYCAVDLYFELPSSLLSDEKNFVYVDKYGEHPVPNHDKYHPFIADGKVWKTGRVTMPGVPAFDVNYYYLEGDTVIKSEQYQKLMRTNVTKERKVTVYNGALREEGKKVYYSGGLLYDFDAQIGDTLEVYGFPNTKAIIEKRDVVDLNGYSVRRTLLGVYGLNEEENEYGIINHDAWYEGIGYQAGPCEGLDPGYSSGMYYNTLMSCTIYNDTLYSDARYTDAVSEYWDEDSETKKQKIDFTHVIKTKPTSPQPVSTNISLLWGEYSNAVLNIDFEGMNGRYKINVRKDGEQQDRFSANQETHNLQSLDVNLAGYPDGDYTVVVE